MKIGETIKKLRVDNKLTQSDLAEMLDVTRVAVSKWELNKSYPSMDNLRAISKIFNVTFDELLEEPKKEPEHSLEEGENEEMGSKDNTPKKSAGTTNNVGPANSQDVSSKPVENDVMASNEHSLEAQTSKAKKKHRIVNWAFGCGMTLIGLAAVTLTSIGLAGTFVVKGEDTSNSNAISSENTSPIQSIYVSQNPTYMTYLVGQSFKTDGMVVTAVHEDDTESELEGWTIDAPESFDSTNNNLTINVKYSDPSGNEFTTDLSGVRVADHMNGVFSPTDLKVTSDPIPQLAGSPFDDTNLAFHLIYDVNGETKEDEEHSYKLNSNPTGNSYDVIKLSENKGLTSDTTDVTILYSQGKSFQLPVTMIESIEITPNKDTYDAKEDKFSVTAKGVKKDGTKIDLNPKFFTFTSSKEKIEAGKSFTYNGEHEITCKYGKYSKKIATFNVTVSGGKDFAMNPNLNDDAYFKECEDLVWDNDIEQTEINACQKLQEVASPFNWEEITSSNQGTYYKDLCGYSEFHAKAYLGYTGNYKYSGNGFVHNFDGDGSDSGAFMRYTFTAPGGGESDLILRGSTNVAGSTIYDSQDLKISKAVKITLNGTDITPLFADKAFKGVTSTTPDAQNRSGEAQGISLEGRYRFVNWTEVKAKVQLQPGENVLMITAKNNGQSGHWDSIKFDCTPYKTPLTEIAHAVLVLN